MDQFPIASRLAADDLIILMRIMVMTMLHCRQVAFYFMSDDDNDVDDVFNSGDNFVSGVWCS